MTGRRRILLTYLTLALVVIGALAHGVLSQPASRLRLPASGVGEGVAIADRGALPTLRGTRLLSDWRKSRTALGGKDDDAPLKPSLAALRDAGPPAAAFAADTGRRLAMMRRAHRPRDPPTPI
jgi:hypothetical protein